MGEPKVVNIKLDTDQNTRALQEGELIHPKEFETVIKLIRDSLRKIEDKRYDCRDAGNNSANHDITEQPRLHDSIVISGSRGTGKTTFLLSLLKKIRTSPELFEESIKSDRCGILVFDIIDPTLIEEKAHLLVNIISRFQQAVHKFACPAQWSIEEERKIKKLEEWEQVFDKLAEGLPVLDGIGTNQLASSDWDDPNYIIREGVRKARAANDLEKNLSEFIEVSLAILNKKAVLICFDDIDTDFTKGWPVLEVLRKYLTSPRIITILSGDLELYSAIVRKSQWKKLGIDLVKGETETSLNRYKELVSQLENQYLLKLLRTERRVSLNTLFNNRLLKKADYQIFWIEKRSNRELEIRIFYEENLFTRFAISSSTEQENTFRFVANLPIRTQIQLMRALVREEKDVIDIFNIFWSNWNEFNSNYSVFVDNPDLVPMLLVKFLFDEKYPVDGYRLIPIESYPPRNGALFASGIFLQSQFAIRPHLIFDYFIRICITSEVRVRQYPLLHRTGTNFTVYRNHTKIESEIQLTDIAGLFNSFLVSDRLFPSSYFLPMPGSISLRSLKTIRKRSLEGQLDRILAESNNNLVYRLGLLPLTSAYLRNGRTIPIYSVFNLFGIIGELLREFEIKEEINQEEIIQFFVRYSALRVFPISSTGDIEQRIDLPFRNDDTDLKESPNDKLADFADKVIHWIRRSKTNNFPSPYLVAKTSSRFFDNAELASLHRQTANLGEWMSIMVLNFIQSAIQEEAISIKYDRSTRNNSPSLLRVQSSSRYFWQNLNILLPEIEKFPFTAWLLSCPLLGIFIDTSDQKYVPSPNTLLSPVAKNEVTQNIIIQNLFYTPKDLIEVLNNINMVGDEDESSSSKNKIVIPRQKSDASASQSKSQTVKAENPRIRNMRFNPDSEEHSKIVVEFCKKNGIEKDRIVNLEDKRLKELIRKSFSNTVIIPNGTVEKFKAYLKASLNK